MTEVTEQHKRAQDNGASPERPVGCEASGAGGIPVMDPKSPDAKNILENHQRNLDRLSKELDEYFSMRRLMPRE